MPKSASGIRRRHGATGGSAVAALFGAAATVVVLTGIVAIADSPRSLSDDARLPASAELFDVTPLAAPELPSDVYSIAPATGHRDDSVLLVASEFQS